MTAPVAVLGCGHALHAQCCRSMLEVRACECVAVGAVLLFLFGRLPLPRLAGLAPALRLGTPDVSCAEAGSSTLMLCVAYERALVNVVSWSGRSR